MSLGQVGTLIVAGALAFTVAPAAVTGDDEDKQIAREVVLKLSDLPDGWESEPSDEPDEPFGTYECRAVDRAFDSIYGEIDGKPRKYVKPERDVNDPDVEITATEIENAIALFPNARATKRVFRVVESDETRACFEQAAMGAAADIGAAEGELVLLDVSGGDGAIGYTIVLGDGNPSNSFFLDLVVARVGRALSVFSAFNIGSSLPEGPDVLDAIVGRLERAL